MSGTIIPGIRIPNSWRGVPELASFFNQLIRFITGNTRTISYTVATLPDATAAEGIIIYVSDEVGGAVLAFSDGADWRRVTDRAIVS